MAIVGKNGCGKTTLARAIRNISFADTFIKTAAVGIFNADSSIEYELDAEKIVFSYDNVIRSLNCRQTVPSAWKTAVSAELSIPFGERFNFFKSISDADLDIRSALILEDFDSPLELIAFLKSIYRNEKFASLVEVRVKRSTYYCIRLPDGRYIREDYFSSGEYFLVNLYKRIRSRCRLIFVDEIDISLDAAAQVRLVTELRSLCAQYGVNVTFTTHSLAMMRTLDPRELYYMDTVGNEVQVRLTSYSYVKSVLYGFRGWDRYILTEDDVLKEFIEFIISKYQQPEFSPRLADDARAWNSKSLFKELIRQRLMSRSRIFEYLCDKNDNEMREFSRILAAFLTEPNIAAGHATEE
jgi:ABC-type dipeptide/oligopeptide/nickel transport system ATPase subunit